MSRFRAVLAIFALGICQVTSLAFDCPSGAIFCDNFDTYCLQGGYPGDPVAACTGDVDKPTGTAMLTQVWANTPINDGSGGVMMEDGKELILDGYSSARYTAQFTLGQKTVRDWVQSPALGQPGQIFDLRRFIGQAFNDNLVTAVNGTDEAPLSMEFMIGMNVEKLFFSSTYMELAYANGSEDSVGNDNLNRANTDYVELIPNCCGYGLSGPFQAICAQGNPDPATPVPAACPSVATNPPPVHTAVAVGQLSFLDLDPCNCPQTLSRQKVTHLALYDGQVWWTLRKDGAGVALPPGVVVTGSITALNGGPTDPLPADFNPEFIPGDFRLSSSLKLHKNPDDPNEPPTNSFNTVKLTVKKDTIKVELTTKVLASVPNPDPDPNVPYLYYWYNVYSSMDNIPRKYAGAFNRVRMGVGQGCKLASNASWDACAGTTKRAGIYVPYGTNRGYYIDYDNFVLQGGEGVKVPGACCMANGSCAMMLRQDCEALNGNGDPIGHFLSDGMPCDGSVHCCPLIYGDITDDGIVDMNDFAKLQTCLTVAGGTMDSSCRCLDFDGNSSISDPEVVHFAECANGPGISGNTKDSCKGIGW